MSRGIQTCYGFLYEYTYLFGNYIEEWSPFGELRFKNQDSYGQLDVKTKLKN